MRLFITGATGFIGAHVVQQALSRGCQVRALRQPGCRPRIGLTKEPEWVDAELSAAQPSWFKDVDVLIHLAAAGVSPQKIDWVKAHQINVVDALGLLVCARESEVKGAVACGTCMEYGTRATEFERIPPTAPLQPAGAYATSKAAFFTSACAFAEEAGMHLSYLRLFHVFGEGQSEENFWPSLRRAALAGQDFTMTAGDQVRDFMHVQDVATRFLDEAVRMAAHPPETDRHRSRDGGLCAPEGAGERDLRQNMCGTRQLPRIHIANVGTGRPQTLRQFAEFWWEKWGAKGRLIFGALPYRDNEVMRYVPEVEMAP